MKKICIFVLLLSLLVGCKDPKSDNSSFLKTPVAEDDEYVANFPVEYKELLSQYQVIVNSWSSDNGEEGYPNFTKDFENGKLPYPNGAEKYEWDEMLIDGKYPKNSKYGYVLKDINSDTVPEMFWVYEDYTLLAAFTVADGKAITIGAYRPKAKAIVLDSGEIFEYRSAGADIYECSILVLKHGADCLTATKTIGRYRDEYFYELKDNQKIIISKAEFDSFVKQYSLLLEATDMWKTNKLFLVQE